MRMLRWRNRSLVARDIRDVLRFLGPFFWVGKTFFVVV